MAGMVYVVSMVLLIVVVAVVYSAAQQPFAPMREVGRRAVRRGAKLAAVLAGLMIIVHFLSRI